MLENDQADSMGAHGTKWNGLTTLLNYRNLIKGLYFPSARSLTVCLWAWGKKFFMFSMQIPLLLFGLRS